VCYEGPMRLVCLILLAVAAGCSGREESPSATTTTTHQMTPQDLIAIEQTPGVTPPLEDATEPAPNPVAGLEGAPGPSPAFGPADAAVYVVVFTDFQCPVCRRAVEPLKHLARDLPADVRIVLKNNALVLHPRAAASAAAAMAAFRQGKFWAYHDRLFTTQQLDDPSLVAHAQALGLDVERFKRDMADEKIAAQISYESALAKTLGLGGTPALVIDGKTQVGWGSYMGTAGDVHDALERARKLAAGGVPAARLALEATRQIGPEGPTIATALFANGGAGGQ
jgi:protein-disulfide isomerase